MIWTTAGLAVLWLAVGVVCLRLAGFDHVRLSLVALVSGLVSSVITGGALGAAQPRRSQDATRQGRDDDDDTHLHDGPETEHIAACIIPGARSCNWSRGYGLLPGEGDRGAEEGLGRRRGGRHIVATSLRGRIPGRWTAVQYREMGPAMAIGEGLKQTDYDAGHVTGSNVTIRHAEGKTTSQEYLEKLMSTQRKAPGFALIGQGQTTLDGRDAVWCSYSVTAKYGTRMSCCYAVAADEDAYAIECTSTAEEWAAVEPTFGAMVSSFKITKTKM